MVGLVVLALLAASLSSGTLPRRLMTVEEAAQFLGVSRNNLYIAAREGRVPSFKVGSLVRLMPTSFVHG
jgi:excisionase family DNA binding protein